jgi:hypothetical protein
MRDISSDDRLEELFIKLLDSFNPRLRAYVYPLKNGKLQKPAIFKGCPFPNLVEFLINEYGTAEYRIMIREGETMLLAGDFAVAAPLTWRPKTPSL